MGWHGLPVWGSLGKIVGLRVTDLPNFDDVSPYGATDEVQQQLWELEAKRLVKAVTGREPLRFRGSENLSVDSKEAYALLANLADRVVQALTIIIHDGQSLLAEHHKLGFNSSLWRDCQIALGYMCERDDQDGGVIAQNTEDFFGFVDYCTAISARYLCSATKGPSFHVNVLAHVAKITTKIKVVAADLAKHAKISLENGAPDRQIAMPDEHGVRGVSRTTNMSTILVNTGTDQAPGKKPARENDVGDDPEGLAMDYVDRLMENFESRMFERLAPLESEQKKKALRVVYFQMCESYRYGLIGMLQGFLLHLRGTSKLTQTFSTSYEISAMVYETGFERFRTLVFQDEGHNFDGTSDALMVNYARNGFHLLNSTLEHMQKEAMLDIDTPDNQDAVSVGTAISWNYTPDSPSTGPKSPSTQARRVLKLRSMSDTITVLVPLLLSNPHRTSGVARFFNRVTFSKTLRLHSQLKTDDGRKIPFKPFSYPNYTAYFSLSTEEYRLEQSSGPPDRAKSLSNALMRRNNLHRGEGLTALPRVNSNAFSTPDLHKTGSPMASHKASDQSALERIESRRQELDRVRDIMKSWVFEENGVVVACRGYVALTMFFCALLVGGGIAVGATVGERIHGVDPFNITTYCWVLAAFVLLVAKSVRVHEWPWNDFLHCRVLCRSVSELSSVTGIDDQLILAKLLQDEAVSCLDTRGPFNAVFRRKSKGGDGFSIDRPIGMWAMLISGLIMLEVESMNGRGVVCLDLRRGTKYAVIQNQTDYYRSDSEKKPRYIYCTRVIKESTKGSKRVGRGGVQREEEDGGGKIKLVLKCGGDIVWMRALGFYSNKDAVFI
ncbi:hypothetical protein B0T20DRAFT_494913 [Sordaria brevicollis]|uniref:Uncharacterized protein n=1 Tax=Sordaria brevicollis TaxID=83679 RepID=A0AAE0PJ16_SORBR|nr:hypothetical protein B0T20DRAFT_494913 [Sordaria brevicollis]